MLKQHNIIQLCCICLFVCLSIGSAFAEKSIGKFILLDKTASHPIYGPGIIGGGSKLKSGDVLLYTFSSYIKKPNGTITGGLTKDTTFYRSLQIFRSAKKRFERTALPNYFHSPNSALLPLPDGRALLAGVYCSIIGPGETGDSEVFRVCDESRHVEIYDPTSNTFKAAASMLIPRSDFGTALLKNGKILFVGGNLVNKWRDSDVKDQSFYEARTNIVKQAEIYDPTIDQFTLTGAMKSDKPDIIHASIVLNDGKVLILGYINEIYEPVTGHFRQISNTVGRSEKVNAIKLKDGRVLVLPENNSGRPVQAEIFDPKTETFKVIGHMVTNHGYGFSVVLLGDGRALISGGAVVRDNPLIGSYRDEFNNVEIFDPEKEVFYPAGKMKSKRVFHKTFLLNDGTVLLVGGDANAELLKPLKSK